MSKPYIERRHVQLSEEVEYYLDSRVSADRWWRATAYGPLTPSKEHIDISREGSTAEEAYANLKSAVEEQGWGIR